MKDRIFFDVPNPEDLLLKIRGGRSWFVPTLLSESLHQHVQLVARLRGGREVEFDVIVVGRRARASAGFPKGVEVRAQRSAPGVRRLEELLSDFHTGPLAMAEARFERRADLYAAAERLLAGEAVMISVDQHVPRGAHAFVQMRAPGESVDLILDVVGTGRVDREWHIRAVLYDADSCATLRRRLAAPTRSLSPRAVPRAS